MVLEPSEKISRVKIIGMVQVYMTIFHPYFYERYYLSLRWEEVNAG